MQNHKSVVQKWLSYCNLKTCKNTIFFQSLHICVQCVIFYRHGSVLSTLPKIIRCHPHSLQNNAKQDQASKAPSAVSPIIFLGLFLYFLTNSIILASIFLILIVSRSPFFNFCYYYYFNLILFLHIYFFFNFILFL